MRRTMILGLGRSGTSWLMKIFDHHPMVFAIYEPESLTARSTPSNAAEPSPQEIAKHVEEFFACRGLRAIRRRPILRKAYRSISAHFFRTGLIYGLSGLARLARIDQRIAALDVPDMADLSSAHHVVKCVSGESRFPEFMSEDLPVRIVFILRHPCGQALSHLRGIELGKMNPLYLPERRLLASIIEFGKPASELVEADFDMLEILAIRWAVYNGLAIRKAEGLRNVRVVRYEDLCADPIGEAQAIFAWAGLDWRPECEAFLRDSLTQEGEGATYHAVSRNPQIAADRWKSRMTAPDIDRVKAICRHSPAAKYFPDLVDMASG
jgi:hypothetical protein